MNMCYDNDMRKLFAFLLVVLGMQAAYSADSWWDRPTVCKLDSTKCYSSMGAGYLDGMWDADSRCWGMKLVCPSALIGEKMGDAEPIGKKAITAGLGLSSDFDFNSLKGDCFGVRKTREDGTLASVNGTFVKVWCRGVLANSDEEMPNGEIVFSGQPKCKELARDGYVAVRASRCYGKQFDAGQYYIECAGNDELPQRLVRLGGARDFVVSTTNYNLAYPTSQAEANKIFDKMNSVSKSRRDNKAEI